MEAKLRGTMHKQEPEAWKNTPCPIYTTRYLIGNDQAAAECLAVQKDRIQVGSGCRLQG